MTIHFEPVYFVIIVLIGHKREEQPFKDGADCAPVSPSATLAESWSAPVPQLHFSLNLVPQQLSNQAQYSSQAQRRGYRYRICK